MGGTVEDVGEAGARGRPVFMDHVVVLLDCDRPLSGSARYGLSGVERILVGRGDRRAGTRADGQGILDLRLPDRAVSTTHAELRRAGGGWEVIDRSSKNGTFVSGERVESSMVAPDDLVQVGHTFLRIVRAVATPEGTPLDRELDASAPGEFDTLDPVLASRLGTLAKLAPTSVPLLVLGESGVGKEVLARWVHSRAGRKGTFVAVNCGAIPPTLMESQLFGHVKGAFSGALSDATGFVRAAERGTLFLDEIADLPKASQAALLRVIQEREVVPVGSVKPVPVDIRLLAATHAPLASLVESGDFRRDLFARIAGVEVTIPPLRERAFDLGLLVGSLIRKLAGARAEKIVLAPSAGLAILRHDWPLNVRGLEQALAACVALADESAVIMADHLPTALTAARRSPPAEVVEKTTTEAAPPNPRDEQLRLELIAHFVRHKGNVTEVAREMGKARTQIQRWCTRLGIDPSTYRGERSRPDRPS